MGVLTGIEVVEMSAIGPVPLCGMLLADMGADVIRIDRTGPSGLGVPMDARLQIASRGKRSIALNLKDKEGLAIARRLIDRTDVVIEGFRPGVMERLGLGPVECHERNPGLVYGRMTGWGQSGPWAHTAGHDINYIALTGALHAIGEAGRPPIAPLNLVGDYGGGSLYLGLGVLGGLLERSKSGRGQVVDAAMVDGATSLMTQFFAMSAAGRWSEERGTNAIDGGAHFYGVYETSDNKYMAVGAIEEKFYKELLTRLGLDGDKELIECQMQPSAWPRLRDRLAAVFRTKTRDQWAALFEGSDACVAPILSLSEARAHPHMSARNTLVEIDGVVQPAPAPRFDRTPSIPAPARTFAGEHTAQVLASLGFGDGDVASLKERGVVH